MHSLLFYTFSIYYTTFYRQDVLLLAIMGDLTHVDKDYSGKNKVVRM